jgi:uncharacterized membrane protein
MFSRIETIHPLIVHFPIVIGVLYLLAELSFRFVRKRQQEFDVLLLTFATLGALSSFFANFSGELAQNVFTSNQMAMSLIQQHANVALFVFWNFLALVVVGVVSLVKVKSRIRDLRLALSLLLIVLIIIAAHRGSELVYQHGIGILP